MKRTSVNRWALWLLPLLVARAFVPMGFMVSADASGLSLVFCTTTASTNAPSQAAHHDHSGHQDHSAHHQDQASEQHVDTMALCPYALAGASVSHDIALPALGQPPRSYDPILNLGRTLGPRLLTSHLIRGPPALA